MNWQGQRTLLAFCATLVLAVGGTHGCLKRQTANVASDSFTYSELTTGSAEEVLHKFAVHSFLFLKGEGTYTDGGRYQNTPVDIELAAHKLDSPETNGMAQGKIGLWLTLVDKETRVNLVAISLFDLTTDAWKEFLGGKGASALTLKGRRNVRNEAPTPEGLVPWQPTELVVRGSSGPQKEAAPARISWSIQGQFKSENNQGFQAVLHFPLKTAAIQAAGPTEVVTVGTYNIENFWDDNDENTHAPYDSFARQSSDWVKSKAYLPKARRVAEAISLAGSPDILGIQECESAQNNSSCLKLLKPELQKLGYEHFALGHQHQSDPVAVTSAIISKFPIEENTFLNFTNNAASQPTAAASAEAEEYSSARDPQVATVSLGAGNTLRIYNGHWKSKRGSSAETEEERVRIAELIRTDIDKTLAANAKTDVVVMGDFNSEYNETQIANLPRSGAVEGLDATGDEREMVKPASRKLYNLWYQLPENRRCSYSHDGKRTCIDNMLVSNGLYDNNGFQLVRNSFRIVGRSGGIAQERLLNADGTPLRWQVKREGKKNAEYWVHLGVGYSDHLPLVVDFKTYGATPGEQRLTLPQGYEPPQAPRQHPEEIVPLCSPSETPYHPQETNFLYPEFLGQCFSIEKGTQKLEQFFPQVGVYYHWKGVASPLIISMTHSFGRNMQFLRNELQRAKGHTLIQAKGRLGWSMGYPALFVHEPAQVLWKKAQ